MQHRYYGKSFPFGGNEEDANANSSTLGYLSSTLLIIDLKKNLSATYSPVVVFGGSYGGIILYIIFYQKLMSIFYVTIMFSSFR